MTKNRKAQKDIEVVESAETAASENSAPSIETGERSETGFYVPRGKHKQTINATLYGARCPKYCPPVLFVGRDPETQKYLFLTESMTPLEKHAYENVGDLVKVAKAARELCNMPEHENTRIFQLVELAELAALPELAEQRKAEIEAREAAKRQRKLGVKVRETKSGDVTLQVTPAIMNQYVEHCIAHPGSSLAAFLENLGVADIPNLPKVEATEAEKQLPADHLEPTR